MRKIITIILTAFLSLCLAACSNNPSDEKIKTALDDGTLTMEDAKAKGWIDDEWIEKNFEFMDGGSKIHLFDPFKTTYLDGTPASSKLIEGRMCLVFFNTQKPDTMNKLKTFNDISKKMADICVPVLGIATDKDLALARKNLKSIKFPIIVFNGEMQESLKDYSELMDTDLVSVLTKDGGFYSAWNSSAIKEDLLSDAEDLAHEE